MLLETVYENLWQKYSFELVAGAQNIRRRITWYHIIENITVIEFIRGSELVFTTGMGYTGEDWLISFIRELNKQNACGLVVNIGPYISAIPQSVIDLCDSNAFPLFTIPWEVHLVDITRDFSQFIIENERSLFQSTTAMKNVVTNTNREENIIQLTETGYPENGRYCAAQIACFDSGWNKDETLKIVQDILLLNRYGVAFSHNSSIVVVYVDCTKKRIEESIKLLKTALKKRYPEITFYFGLGSPGQGIGTVEESYRRATYALSVARMRESPCLFYENISLYKLLFEIDDKSLLEQFVDDTLGKIILYDRTHKTDYIKWLDMYLRYDGSVQQISKEAFCHRNTVNYKIKRIRELFGLDTNSNEQKAAIFIALHIVKMLDKPIIG